MQAQREADLVIRQTQATHDAKKRWEAAHACTEHPYLTAKGIKSHGVKLEGDNLLVPMRDTDGALWSLQTIGPDGIKKNMPSGRVKGCYCRIVGLSRDVVVIAEGFATGASIHEATGSAVVVCFNSGNLEAVALAIRDKHPDLKIIVAADDDHTTAGNPGLTKARAAATAVNGWLAIPDFSQFDRADKDSDFNDLYRLAGPEAVKACIDKAQTQPPEPVHPLAKFIDLDSAPKPPRWVIPGFISDGVTVISGAAGVGKTTALLPLALTVAGLHGDDLMPSQWRHVVYISEDVDQAQRILAGIVNHGNLNISMETVRERFHIVRAVRLDPAFVASVGLSYRKQFTREVKGVEVLPLVILDTKSAVLAVESENDNAEASRMMAALKQGFDGLPVWIVGHIAKANLGRSDVAALTSRGAGAIEGDAHQTMFLVKEGESRFLVLGKVRFEPRWQELEITSYCAQEQVHDEFGDVETVVLRWGVCTPAQQSRKEAAEQATEQQHREDEATLRDDIREAIEVAWLTGNPLNRAGVMALLKRKRQTVGSMIENLLNERWIHEVPVPAKVRIMNCKAAFLINLSTVEHEAVLAGGGLPCAKIVIPASWQKEPIPHVPDANDESVKVAHE